MIMQIQKVNWKAFTPLSKEIKYELTYLNLDTQTAKVHENRKRNTYEQNSSLEYETIMAFT